MFGRVCLPIFSAAVVGLVVFFGGAEVFAQATSVEIPSFVASSDLTGVMGSMTNSVKPILLCVLGVVIGIAIFRIGYGFFRSMGR